MATLYSNNFDTTPAADETTVTTAVHTSAGAGIDIPRIQIGATGGIKWDSDTPHTGTRSIRVDGGSPPAFTAFNPYEFVADANQLYIRGYSRVSALPTGNITIASVANSTPAQTAGLQFLTSGQLRIKDGVLTVDTSTVAFDAMDWFGWEWHIDAVAHTQEMRVYDADFTDVRATLSGAFSGTIRRISLGNITGWDAAMSAWYDDIVVSDSGYPGPLGGADPDPPGGPLYANNFDTTPAADETTVTTAAHTSGSAGIGVPRVTIGATAGIKWDSATPHSGSHSIRVDGGNPVAFTTFNPYESGTDMSKIYVRGYSRCLTLPAANATIAGIQNGTPTLTAGLQFLTTGQLRIRNGAVTVDTTDRDFDPMEWFGWEWFLDATADTQTLKVYDGAYSNLRDTLTGAFTGAIQRVELGNITNWDPSWSVWYDDIVIGQDDYAGPLGGPAPIILTGWRLANPSGPFTKAKVLLPDGSGGWV